MGDIIGPGDIVLHVPSGEKMAVKRVNGEAVVLYLNKVQLIKANHVIESDTCVVNIKSLKLI